LVAGGPGNDTLDGGPGANEINANEGQKDTVVIRPGEGDAVYYDKGLDVLVAAVSSQGTAGLSAAEGDEKVELSAERLGGRASSSPTARSWWGKRARSCSWSSRRSRGTLATATR
jgi:Ca2+-binding RTX toxin-like protein